MNKTRVVQGFVCIAVLLAVLFVGVWQIKPAQAAEIFSDGFELNPFSEWDDTAGSPTVVTSPVHHGINACRLIYSYDTQRVVKNIGSSYTVVFFRSLVRYSSGSWFPVGFCWDSSINVVWDLQFNSSHLIFTRYYPSTLESCWAVSIAMDTWLSIKVKMVKASGSGGEFRVYVDGVERITDSGIDTSSVNNFAWQGIGWYENYGDALTMYADCAVIADTDIGEESGGGSATENEYITVNSTATYEWNSTWGCVASGSDSVGIINTALTHVSALHGSLFVYNGTYQVYGSIEMQSNVNMTLQDGVFFNETSDGTVGQNSGMGAGHGCYIIYLSGISNSSIYANSNATIHGLGLAGYDYEVGFRITSCNNITIAASQPNGLKIYNIGTMWLYGSNINNSLFQNLHGYLCEQMDMYPFHVATVDGLQNVQFINITSDGAGGNSRCPLLLCGYYYPVNNVTITGGLYENSLADNGIYLGGWEQPITNVVMTNVTTYNNTNSGHSGIKFRPACNVTITGWNSTGDYNGMEVGTSMPGETSTYLDGGSWYNNVSGTINAPLSVGLILYIDDSDINQSVRYNTFNLAVLNSSGGSCWIDNSAGLLNNQVTYNTITLNSTGADTNAIGISGNGNISQNTFYGTFIDNGKDGGYYDINLENTTAQHHNTFNIYSTVGNPYGLMNFVNGTGSNFVFYPYPGGGGVSVFIVFPTNTTYTSSTVSVELYASGGTIDTIWWNCWDGAAWLYVSNQTYTGPTSMTGLGDDTYTFYGWANNTLGDSGGDTVVFSVLIIYADYGAGFGSWWGDWW